MSAALSRKRSAISRIEVMSVVVPSMRSARPSSSWLMTLPRLQIHL